MLSYLRGTLQAKEIISSTSAKLVIDIAGVGFELTVAWQAMATVGEIGQEITIHTALVMRENEWTIFGFINPQEKEMFILLQSVTGVGPKLALTLIGAIGVANIIQAIASSQEKLLVSAPGVGLKVAQRIILELKPKIASWKDSTLVAVAAKSKKQSFLEARSILEGLGYTSSEINLVFSTMEEHLEEEDVEGIIRLALKTLSS